MKLFRFLFVVALMTLLGGAFGATVGGLFGYAMPRQLRFETRVESENTATGPDGTPQGTTTGKAFEVGVGPEVEASPAMKGASLGGALGLVTGSILGFLLAFLDLALQRAMDWSARRREAAS
jgi:hypothetical protein